MQEAPKYRILRELGSGGMGTISQGVLVGQAGFQRPIVIKQIKDADDADHVRLFVEEARRYALLDHENIGRIFDFERVDQRLCIILEFIDGWSLVEYLARHKSLGRLPDVELTVFIVSRVCRALQYVYERAAIVHRDVSPGNIMMTREGTVKLIDFGIATHAGTRDLGITGKPAYMAPEMVVQLKADNRSDVFSLGAVCYEMLTGERLFVGRNTAEVLENVIAGTIPSPRRHNPDIPEGVLAILRRALQREPARRFATAGEMGEACEHFLYDKGYGPTNLTLKQHLSNLFPGSVTTAGAEAATGFSALEPTLVRMSDASETPRPRFIEEPTPVPRALLAETAVPPGTAQAELGSVSRAAMDQASIPTRRIKARSRPR